MSDGAVLSLPWSCGQHVEWRKSGALHEGRLTTWRGPRTDGLYVLTVLERVGDRLVMVTLLSPEPQADPNSILEAVRYA